METYQGIKARHSEEFGKFEGIFFAFSNEQLAEGMKQIGLEEKDYSKIVSLGAGGYLRKDCLLEFKDLCARHKQEMKDFKQNEKALVEALAYELANHEYVITGNPAEAVERLGYTMETVPKAALEKAIKQHNLTCVY